jgi:hypothetical protein
MRALSFWPLLPDGAGVGVSLMTMQLIIGIGVQFLQQFVASTSQTPDAG